MILREDLEETAHVKQKNELPIKLFFEQIRRFSPSMHLEPLKYT